MIKHRINYKGNRRQLNRFIYQLLKKGFRSTHGNIFADLKRYSKYFKADCSIQTFTNGEILVLNHEHSDYEYLKFTGKQYKQALSIIN